MFLYVDWSFIQLFFMIWMLLSLSCMLYIINQRRIHDTYANISEYGYVEWAELIMDCFVCLPILKMFTGMGKFLTKERKIKVCGLYIYKNVSGT